MFTQYCYACKTFATEFDTLYKQYNYVKARITMFNATIP